ncbi:methyltransferase [Rhodospirillaceae bacterium SYSU D60014]|uniref:methyltransferase n=1 Tax=Virgifigura deserti TaxID=2268457 RepID=UPI0013C52201
MMDIWDCALGFMNAQALLTAEEMGVFDALDSGPRTAVEIADAVGLRKDLAERLLTTLCALGFLERWPDGRFANGPEAAEKLVRGKPGYVGAMFRHIREDLYPVWRYLPEALADGSAQWSRAFGPQPAPTERMYSDQASLRAFLEGMHAITYQAGTEFSAQAPELNGVRRLVDVGGASGAFLISVAQSFRSLQGTVFDLPAVGPVAEDFFRQYGLADRLNFHGGDFWEDPIPAGADCYSLGFILHDWDMEGGSHILARIAEAVRPGGLLIIGEYLLNEDRTGPLHVARMDLNMLVAARGRERTAREYAEWIGAFDFELQRIQPTSMGKHFLIARR